MTTEKSICIKCEHLSAFTNAYCVSNNRISLISECEYGGKNAGNRKKCKRFEETNKETIRERLNVFRKKENN